MDIIVGMLLFIIYLCHRKQGERRLVVRPVHLNFNYWKRTEEAGCATGLLYLVDGDIGKYVYLLL
jgi:hypothetical protein